MNDSEDVFDRFNERIEKYPRFLRDYYFSSREIRENNIKNFYSAIPKNSIIFEGACGKTSKIRKCNSDTSKIKQLVGLDLLVSSVKLNNDLDCKIVGNLDHIPLKKNHFDVVHLSNVVEHLIDPLRVFQESSYILKKGGILLISTKNGLNPFMYINRFLPMGFRYWVKKIILKSPKQHLDTFPAPYKCNSRTKIRKALAGLGLKEEQVWFWGWPLIITSPIGLFISMIYEKLTDMKYLRFGKPNIYAKFRKI